jgi:hypothetical protein
MHTTYALFPDARESEENLIKVNALIRVRGADLFEYHSPFHPVLQATNECMAWIAHGKGLNSDEMIGFIRKVAWHYPVLLVYRTENDTRWSFMTVGVNDPNREEWPS